MREVSGTQGGIREGLAGYSQDWGSSKRSKWRAVGGCRAEE